MKLKDGQGLNTIRLSIQGKAIGNRQGTQIWVEKESAKQRPSAGVRCVLYDRSRRVDEQYSFKHFAAAWSVESLRGDEAATAIGT